jgi:hypothetical protein
MAKKAAKWLNDGRAVVIFRNTGQVLNGARIREKSFKVETPDLGTLTIKTDAIASIVYKNLPTFPTDVLRTLGGSEFNGEILNDPVRIDAEELGGEMPVAKAKLISIIF